MPWCPKAISQPSIPTGALRWGAERWRSCRYWCLPSCPSCETGIILGDVPERIATTRTGYGDWWKTKKSRRRGGEGCMDEYMVHIEYDEWSRHMVSRHKLSTWTLDMNSRHKLSTWTININCWHGLSLLPHHTDALVYIGLACWQWDTYYNNVSGSQCSLLIHDYTITSTQKINKYVSTW